MADEHTCASERIDEKIRELGDWRGETLSTVRGIIRDADPEVVEEWKWAKATNPERRSGRTTATSVPVRPTRAW